MHCRIINLFQFVEEYFYVDILVYGVCECDKPVF